MKKKTIEIMNSNYKAKLSDYIPKLVTYEKDEIKNEQNEKKKNSDKEITRSICKSKGKKINNLPGKKLYIANKRYLSNNQIKKISFK